MQTHTQTTKSAVVGSPTPEVSGLLQRKCACGGSSGSTGACAECRRKRLIGDGSLALQPKLMISEPGDRFEQEADRVAQRVMHSSPPAIRSASDPVLDRSTCRDVVPKEVPASVQEVLRSPGQPLPDATRASFEPRFGHDFSQVRVHSDARARESAREVNALAYTVGNNVVFGAGQYEPGTEAGRSLVAHELTHVVQQTGGHPDPSVAQAMPMVQRRAAPYIKKIIVRLAPPQTADLEWEGTAPADATGSDHFTVSTGKGYGDPGDPPGTCTRNCCSDAMTQCAPPWNRPDRVGACCTYYGDTFWTGTPLEEHNTWKWWTPVQPYYSSRGIALHQHTEVTGQPIGHGCVRMLEPNAKRIYDYSNGQRTNVTTEGRAAPVACEADRQCGAAGSGGARIEISEGLEESRLAEGQAPVPGLEGLLT